MKFIEIPGLFSPTLINLDSIALIEHGLNEEIKRSSEWTYIRLHCGSEVTLKIPYEEFKKVLIKLAKES